MKKSKEDINVVIHCGVYPFSILRRINDISYEDTVWCKSFEEAEEIAYILGGICTGIKTASIEYKELEEVLKEIEEVEEVKEVEEVEEVEEVTPYLIGKTIDGIEVIDTVMARNKEEAAILAAELGGKLQGQSAKDWFRLQALDRYRLHKVLYYFERKGPILV